MPEKLYKNRKGRILGFYEANQSASPGDKMVDSEGIAYRLEQSTGYWKRNAGDLTPRLIKPPHSKAKAVIRNGQLWWHW